MLMNSWACVTSDGHSCPQGCEEEEVCLPFQCHHIDNWSHFVWKGFVFLKLYFIQLLTSKRVSFSEPQVWS